MIEVGFSRTPPPGPGEGGEVEAGLAKGAEVTQ